MSNETNIQVDEKNCIEKVILLDDSLGSVRNHVCEKISLTETIEQYISGIDIYDYTNCSESFRTAFKKHIFAWTEMKYITDKHPELRGEMHELFKILEASNESVAFKILLDGI